jgi:hypothetical protein
MCLNSIFMVLYFLVIAMSFLEHEEAWFRVLSWV